VLPAINPAHVDLAWGEQRPEQHRGRIGGRQHGLGFDPPLAIYRIIGDKLGKAPRIRLTFIRSAGRLPRSCARRKYRRPMLRQSSAISLTRLAKIVSKIQYDGLKLSTARAWSRSRGHPCTICTLAAARVAGASANARAGGTYS
jgi:hypothetical protein